MMITGLPDHPLIHVAVGLMVTAHAGKKDKAGADYWTHPARVARTVLRGGASIETVAAALLHDTLEDSDLTADDLAVAGMPRDVIDTVVKLTRVKGPDAPTYMEYIRSLDGDVMALRVKMADIEDHLSVKRRSSLPATLKSRYRRAEDALLDMLLGV